MILSIINLILLIGIILYLVIHARKDFNQYHELSNKNYDRFLETDKLISHLGLKAKRTWKDGFKVEINNK